MRRQLDMFNDLGYPREGRTESGNSGETRSQPGVTADNGVVSDQSEKSLLERILERGNLNAAYKKVRANGGSPGVDGMDVKEGLLTYLKRNKGEILQQIRTRRYKPKPLLSVDIPKEKPGEYRELKIPSAVDRVIQQAMAQELYKIYNPTFSANCCGYREGMGCVNAVKKVRKYANEGYHIAISLDLSKFFDTVPQMRLISLLQTRIKDNGVISLIHKFLRAGVERNGRLEKTEVGIPQGGPLSPLLSNIYLDQLDKELERRGHKFVRYADDTIILLKSRKAAKRVLESIARFIEEKLGLKVNRDKTVIANITKVKYLGYGFYYHPGKKEYRFLVHPKSKDKLKEKLRKLTREARGMSYKEFKKKLTQTVNGWVNYFYLADCGNYLQDIDMWLRRRIRTLIWKRWRRVRTRYRKCRNYGLSHKAAIKTANIRKGPWRASASPRVNQILNNERLAKWGFPSLFETYKVVRKRKTEEGRRKKIEYYLANRSQKVGEN